MSDRHSAVLGFSSAMLQVLRGLNLLSAAVLVIVFVASFPFEDAYAAFFSRHGADGKQLLPGVRVWMVFAAPVIAAWQVIFTQLLRIVGTVRLGDPFVADNAARLKTIAWCVLAVQVLHLVFGVFARVLSSPGARFPWTFTLDGWIAVVLIFVLARVFEEGTRIRNDLEAMV